MSLPARHIHRNAHVSTTELQERFGTSFLYIFLSQKSDSQNLLSWVPARLNKFHSVYFLNSFELIKKTPTLRFLDISKCFATPPRAGTLPSVQDHHPFFYRVQFFVSPKLTHSHKSARHAKVTGQSLCSDS